ncbi:MAG: hypothetical protein DRJ05_18440 [Bacteroidetes bacterium]|nr:MAG: hypothetical protein DRJ05_18440 [Bacteroidota bacterium]
MLQCVNASMIQCENAIKQVPNSPVFKELKFCIINIFSGLFLFVLESFQFAFPIRLFLSQSFLFQKLFFSVQKVEVAIFK